MIMEKNKDDNVILIGHKPAMSYVLAAVTQFNLFDSEEVILKARGRTISRAVDTAEIIRDRFMKNVEVKDIKINTENITAEDGSTTDISSMEIYLTTNNNSK